MKRIDLKLEKDGGGVSYSIDPDKKTYTTAMLENGNIKESETKSGEYTDKQKFALQLYYLILTSLNDGQAPK